MSGELINVAVTKKANLVFQVQNIPGTDIWTFIEKGDLSELVEKVRQSKGGLKGRKHRFTAHRTEQVLWRFEREASSKTTEGP